MPEVLVHRVSEDRGRWHETGEFDKAVAAARQGKLIEVEAYVTASGVMSDWSLQILNATRLANERAHGMGVEMRLAIPLICDRLHGQHPSELVHGFPLSLVMGAPNMEWVERVLAVHKLLQPTNWNWWTKSLGQGLWAAAAEDVASRGQHHMVPVSYSSDHDPGPHWRMSALILDPLRPGFYDYMAYTAREFSRLAEALVGAPVAITQHWKTKWYLRDAAGNWVQPPQPAMGNSSGLWCEANSYRSITIQHAQTTLHRAIERLGVVGIPRIWAPGKLQNDAFFTSPVKEWIR